MDKDILSLGSEDLKIYLNQYNIGQLVECKFLKKGLNYSYLVVTEKNRYIFRIYRNQWRGLEDILYELEALTYISKHCLGISVPIATINNQYINEVSCSNESYYGVLFSYAEGEIPSINEHSSFKLGEMLGEIHKCTMDFQSSHVRSYDIDCYHLLDEPMDYLRIEIEKYLSKESCGLIYALADYIKNTLSSLKLELGFCHGDLHDWNVHCDDGCYTIFDFDCCGVGYRAYDLAVFWWTLKVNYPEKEELCWEAFKRGYLKTRKLGQADMEAIPLFVMARRYWLAGVLLRNKDVFGTGWINEKGLNIFLGQIKEDIKNFNINF